MHDIIGEALKSEDTKPFWNYIKSVKQEVFGISTLQSIDRTVTLAADKAQALNHQFCSVFTKENMEDFPSLNSKQVPGIDPLIITTNGVQKLLEKIKPKKATGPDQVPARVLKNCSASLAPVFQKLFQKTISSGCLPDDWLNANVVSIYKKGDRTNPANYRPVSLTSIPCKLLEHIIYRHIMDHFDFHQVLTNHQHGFRQGRSCETQLAGLINDLAHSLDKKGQTDMIILDFSKAFDTVPHKRLLYKLKHAGVNTNLLKWIEIFLTARHQQVLLEGETSSETPVTSGVPQGTVLGPLLFLIYINDLPLVVSSNVRLFADDAIVYREIKDHEDSLSLQHDLDALREWEKTWQMSFNAAKCHTMHVSHKQKPLIYNYKMGDHPLTAVDHHPYLGVELSKDLNWSTHINQTSNKANKILGLLRRNLHSCSKSVKESAYKSLVRPRLEYSGAVWDPFNNNNKTTLEKVQRRAARFVCNDYRRKSSVTNMLTSLQWETLELRRIRLRLVTIFKEVNGITPFNLPSGQNINRHTTRQNVGPHIITPPNFNKLCYQYSLYPRTIREWNLLPPDIRGIADVKTFKVKIEQLDLLSLVNKAHSI
jgi:hypothetical protein